jgi:ribonucleoside-diphosphate reductase alpha chain
VGVKIEEITKQLKGISCPMMTWGEGGEKILSCADALSKAIEKYDSSRKSNSSLVKAETPDGSPSISAVELSANTERTKIALCPECGGSVEYKEGCLTCPLCGYTKCL